MIRYPINKCNQCKSATSKEEHALHLVDMLDAFVGGLGEPPMAIFQRLTQMPIYTPQQCSCEEWHSRETECDGWWPWFHDRHGMVNRTIRGLIQSRSDLMTSLRECLEMNQVSPDHFIKGRGPYGLVAYKPYVEHLREFLQESPPVYWFA